MQQILLVEDDRNTRDWLAGLLAQIPGMQAPVCCATATEALVWLEDHRPDIVLVDLGLPDRPGADVIRAVAARHPGCDILVITVFGDEGHVVEALSAGASGYLIKDASLANIREHLAYLRLGGSPMSPRIARMLIRQYRVERPVGQGDIARGAGGVGGADVAAGSEAGGPAPFRPDGVAVSMGKANAVAVATSADVTDASRRESSPGMDGTPTDADLSEREKNVLTGIAKGFTYGEVAAALDISTNTVRTHIKRIYAKLAVNSRSEAVWEYNQREAQRGRPPLR